MLGSGFLSVLSAARNGEGSAWESLYRDLAPIVLGYFRGRGVSDAEDLTGAVFVAVVKELPRFEGDERAFRSWVLTIAHRRMVDWHRGKRSLMNLRSRIEKQLPNGDVETEALERLGVERVRKAISSLAPDQQDVLLLRIISDQTVDEVARILSKTPTAVKALQRRGVAALRRNLIASGSIANGASVDYLIDGAPD